MSFSTPRQVLLTFGIAGLTLAGAPALANDGKAIYEKTCSVCHAAGVANAPKFGDKAAWAPRIATGNAAMLATVIKGKGAMPPRAGTTLKDDEIKAALEFMVAAAK